MISTAIYDNNRSELHDLAVLQDDVRQSAEALNLTMGSLERRFVVPGGNTDGIDYNFPFPTEDGLVDLMRIHSVSPWRQSCLHDHVRGRKEENEVRRHRGATFECRGRKP